MLSNGYRLYLSNSNGWLLRADDENLEWLYKFAKIMRLQPSESDGLPEIKFVKMQSEQDYDVAKAVVSGTCLKRRYDFKTVRISYNSCTQSVVCELENSRGCTSYVNMCYSMISIYDQILNVGGLPIHAGLIHFGGKGVLLAGRGGIGKSTCCRRVPKPWKALSDDEALVVLDGRGIYRAHPLPTWSDYFAMRSENTWDVQSSVPLSGIFFIVQSDVDRVEPVGEGRSAMLIAESASQVYMKFPMKLEKADEIELRKKIFNNACELAKTIRSFYLYVSLTGNFWEHIERALSFE